MSLPRSFSDPAIYFQDSLDFLIAYKWIFYHSNTQYLKRNVFNQFPHEWKEYFTTVEITELNTFPDGLNDKLIMPDSLHKFQQRLQSLKPSDQPFNHIDSTLMKGMSPKKSHEILNLSKLILEKTISEADILIDFGSGLGYLSEILSKSQNFKILGLESDPERVHLAKLRQKDYYPESISSIFYENMNITSDSGEAIQELVKKYFNDAGQYSQTIIGLHACGDLSITAMDLFFLVKDVKNMIIMPCCYHKLGLLDNGCGDRIFKHFPLSSCFMKAVETIPDAFQVLNRPFLRLACQQTVSRWRDMSDVDHQKHGMDMFNRAVIEYLAGDDFVVKKLKGKKQGLANISFDSIKEQFSLRTKNGYVNVEWTEEHRSKLDDLLRLYAHGDKLSEGLTCLQTAIQELCENIVLLDRISFIQEKSDEIGIQVSVEVKKILNDKLSPRCFAFVAEKLNSAGK